MGWKFDSLVIPGTSIIGGRRVISAASLYKDVAGFFRDRNGVLQFRPGARVIRFLMRKHLLSPLGWCPYCGVELFDLDEVERLENVDGFEIYQKKMWISFNSKLPVSEDFIAIEATFFAAFTGLTIEEIKRYIKHGKIKYIRLLYRGIGRLGLLRKPRGVLIVPITLLEKLRSVYEKKNSGNHIPNSIKNGNDTAVDIGGVAGNRKNARSQDKNGKD